jgi:hypothetical protein
MASVIKRLLITVALIIAGAAIWQKLHIVVFVHGTLTQLLVFYLVLAVIIYVLLDEIIDKVARRW